MRQAVRIGVVCEGETDRVAIEWFVRMSLVIRGFDEIAVCRIASYTDQTSRDTQGFTGVLAWLSQSPEQRQRFFVDLFGGDVRTEKFDAIVVHLDADNLSTKEFRNHVHSKYGKDVKNHRIPEKRGFEIRQLIMSVGKMGKVGDGYAVAVAVESTETWCLSSFRELRDDPESMSGATLVQQFMDALHAVERRPTEVFRKANKDPIRWERFCRRTYENVEVLERQCFHYKKLVTDLVRELNSR